MYRAELVVRLSYCRLLSGCSIGEEVVSKRRVVHALEALGHILVGIEVNCRMNDIFAHKYILCFMHELHALGGIVCRLSLLD